MKNILYLGSVGSLIALILVCLLWEIMAPIKSGGSLIILKVLPLLIPLFGILKRKKYTYQWSSMFILFYFTEGVMRAWAESGISRTFALFEIIFSLSFFACVILWIKFQKIEES